MKLKKLMEIQSDMAGAMYFFGADVDFLLKLDEFKSVLGGAYSMEALKNPGSVRGDVPDDVMNAFRPLYDMYRDYLRNTFNEE